MIEGAVGLELLECWEKQQGHHFRITSGRSDTLTPGIHQWESLLNTCWREGREVEHRKEIQDERGKAEILRLPITHLPPPDSSSLTQFIIVSLYVSLPPTHL